MKKKKSIELLKKDYTNTMVKSKTTHSLNNSCLLLKFLESFFLLNRNIPAAKDKQARNDETYIDSNQYKKVL